MATSFSLYVDFAKASVKDMPTALRTGRTVVHRLSVEAKVGVEYKEGYARHCDDRLKAVVILYVPSARSLLNRDFHQYNLHTSHKAVAARPGAGRT